jgi:crotonobetainyl-CoA:carnitine CoA-transferase CaiB-like acyl-CoA transferase
MLGNGQTPGSLGTPLLSDVKVVEFGQLTAGPFAGTLLADLGAEVVHVEDPSVGDPARRPGPHKDGIHLWWKVGSRNKRSATLDLRSTEGQELARRLVRWADVVITNLRPSSLEGWGLDFAGLQQANPRIIMLQVSGFGENTSLRDAPGYGKVGEARSGVVHITGFPDGPPIFTGYSHADTLTGLTGAFAIGCALHRRDVDPDFAGEHIDLALYEPLFRLVEWQVILYDQLGMIPERAGNQIGVVRASLVDCFATKDEDWIIVTSGTPRSVQAIAVLVGFPAEEFEDVQQQVDRRDDLQDRLATWVAEHTCEEALAALHDAKVVAERVYNVADIVDDATYAERGDIISVDDAELGPVRMQAPLPHLRNHPGRVWRTAPSLGADDDLVWREYAGLGDDEYGDVRSRGVVGTRPSDG